MSETGGPVAPSRTDGGEAERWRLADERDFLVRSLADAAAEHAAGDLEEEDFTALCRRDGSRLAEVERRLGDLDRPPAPEGAAEGPAAAAGTSTDTGPNASTEVPVVPQPGGHRPPGPKGGGGGSPGTIVGRHRAGAEPGPVPGAGSLRPGRRRRWWLAAAGTALVVAGVVLLALQLSSPRLPGAPGDGGASLNAQQKIAQQLDQAAVLADRGTVSAFEQALTLYDGVLREDPRQPQALAASGYLEWEVGAIGRQPSLATGGRDRVRRSLGIEADDPSAHLYLGIIEADGIPTAGGRATGTDPAAAVVQFHQFLAGHPAAGTLDQVAPVIADAYKAARQPVPSSVSRAERSGATTTTTTRG